MSKAAPKPKVIKEGYNPEGLKYVTFSLPRHGKPARVITVTEYTFITDAVRRGIVDEIIAKGLSGTIESIFILIYAPLMACSDSPEELPTMDEFSKMSEDSVNYWVEQARKVVPRYFQWMDEAPAETDDPKKKDLTTSE